MTLEDLKTFDRDFLNNRKIILSLNSVLMNFTYIILFFVDVIILILSILIFLKVNWSIYSLICFVSFFILLIILVDTYKKKTLRVLKQVYSEKLGLNITNLNYKTIDEIQYLTLKFHFKTNKINFSKEDLNIIIGALKDEGNRININYSFSLIISMFCIFLGTQMGSYINNVTDVNIYREHLKDFLILIISISYLIVILEYVVKKKISRNRNNQRLIRALENYYINYSD